MSDDDQPQGKVIHVNFGAPRQPEPEPRHPNYNPTLFPDDPVAERKLEIFSRFIDESLVAVTLDSTVPGVAVPAQFMNQPMLILNFSHRFGLPDFTYDEDAICGSLSFGGQPFYCVIPWAAVKALRHKEDGSVAVFDPDMLR